MSLSEANIRPIPVMPSLALPLPIALVRAMIEGRRLLLPGRLVGCRQGIKPVAGTRLQPRPRR